MNRIRLILWCRENTLAKYTKTVIPNASYPIIIIILLNPNLPMRIVSVSLTRTYSRVSLFIWETTCWRFQKKFHSSFMLTKTGVSLTLTFYRLANHMSAICCYGYLINYDSRHLSTEVVLCPSICMYPLIQFQLFW